MNMKWAERREARQLTPAMSPWTRSGPHYRRGQEGQLPARTGETAASSPAGEADTSLPRHLQVIVLHARPRDPSAAPLPPLITPGRVSASRCQVPSPDPRPHLQPLRLLLPLLHSLATASSTRRRWPCHGFVSSSARLLPRLLIVAARRCHGAGRLD